MFVTKYDPYKDFNNFRRSFDLMNSIIDNVQNKTERGSLADFTPAVNSREGEFAYHIEVDLPGVKKENIHVDVENNVLTISGERKVKKESKEDDYYKVESAYGKFTRSFTLSNEVDTENIHAESKDGVLEVVIPKVKKEDKKAKKIEIK